LTQNTTDLNLIIIGEGDERSFLEQLIEKFNLKDRVMLPGYQSRAYNYLTHLDVFVLSSLTEGLPITLLEAMQAKVPIVATRVGGVPEVLENGKNGLLVKPRYPEKLADAISRIYHDSELRDKLMSCAYKKVITDYTTEKMAMQYLEVYHLLYENK
jgi:glycosyltransferase involved in cell wall biosynthesis